MKILANSRKINKLCQSLPIYTSTQIFLARWHEQNRQTGHQNQRDQTHLAITDHGSMYGAIEFYKKTTKEGIIPILGCEIYLAKG